MKFFLCFLVLQLKERSVPVDRGIMTLLISFVLASFISSTLGISNLDKVQSFAVAEQRKCTYTESVVYDGNGIPSYNYGTVEGTYIGWQRSPITIAQEALRFHDEYQYGNTPKNETAKDVFINNADWLVDNVTLKKHKTNTLYATYEYTFSWPYYDLLPPWRDGMTQARALEVLTRAHNMTGEQKYLETARLLLNSFFVEVKDGGITYKTPDKGWWYEHYADDHTNRTQEPRVLNAMLFAVLGIYDYYLYTDDPLAEFLFYQGVHALENDLPKFNLNGESFYDALGRSAGTFYLPIQVGLLNKLYNATGEPIFKRYHDLWGTHFVLAQYSGKKLEDTYTDFCINQKGLFKINAHLNNTTRILNLLNEHDYDWNAEDDAEIIQTDGKLDVVVDTDKENKSYNRAFLRTELELPELKNGENQEKALLLSLEYVAKSLEGNATFVGEIIDTDNNTQDYSGFTFPLQSTNGEGTSISEIFVVPKSLANKPIEIRLFAITDEPGFHSLTLKKANILSAVPLEVFSLY